MIDSTTDVMVPLTGGTLHNFSDSRCLCRDRVTPAREGAVCEPCERPRLRARCANCGEQATMTVIPSAQQQRDKGVRPHDLCQEHFDLYQPILGRLGGSAVRI